MIHLLLLLRKPFEHRLAPIAIAVFASFLAAPSLIGGFAADDHFLRMVTSGFEGMEELQGKHDLDTFVFASGDIDRNDKFRARGLLPWWSTPDARLAFWRPLASLTHWIDFKLFGDHAWVMHLQNLIWYALLTLIMCALYKRFIGVQWIAIFAAFLYAVDDAHGMPIGWIANRNAIMCMVFGVTTLIMHDRWRRSGEWWALPIGLITFSIGLLCGEATLAITGYIFGHALFMDRGGWFKGLLSLIPYAFIVVPWRLLYQAMGYGATGSGMYLDPGRETGLFLQELVPRMSVLLNSQMFYPPAALTVWATPGIRATHVVLAILLLLFMFWIFFPMISRSPAARVWCVGMVIAVIPVCATFPMDRLLFFVGIGGMGLIGQFLGGLADASEDKMNAPWTFDQGPSRTMSHYLAMALIVLHVIVSPFSIPVRCLTMTFTGHSLHKAVATLPVDEDIREDRVIIMNTPSDFDGWHIPIMRCSLREPIPARTWVLTVGPFSADVKRIDERTLEVRPDGTFKPEPWGSMFRGSEPAFTVGETIDLDGMVVEVLKVSEDGERPELARFTFDVPLESDSLRWFNYQLSEYVPWEPPAIGEEVRLPGSYMFGLGTRAAQVDRPQETQTASRIP